MDEAERLCDELAIMDHGRVIARGTPAGLSPSVRITCGALSRAMPHRRWIWPYGRSRVSGTRGGEWHDPHPVDRASRGRAALLEARRQHAADGTGGRTRRRSRTLRHADGTASAR
jgi:ABC-type multidrug transport system ATPase subunit